MASSLHAADLSEDALLREAHEQDAAETSATFAAEIALLNKLTVAELRILLVHYGYAADAREAKTWRKDEMVDGIAEHRVFRAA